MLKQTKRISFRISSVSSKVEADLQTGFGLQRETVPAPKHGHSSAVGLQSMSFLDLGSGGGTRVAEPVAAGTFRPEPLKRDRLRLQLHYFLQVINKKT